MVHLPDSRTVMNEEDACVSSWEYLPENAMNCAERFMLNRMLLFRRLH